MAHSLEAVSLDKLQDFLVCSICLETVTKPRTLPCFHSYCQHCLETFVKKHRGKTIAGRPVTQFNCPTCRRQFTLNPEDKVAEMSPNHFVLSMLEVMAVDQHRVKGVPCSHCENSSVGRCIDCNVFLCQTCLTDHNRYLAFKGHSVLSMDELSKPENQAKMRGRLYCKRHENKKLKFYCETCGELICRYCTDDEHEKPDHSWSLIGKVAQKEKQDLIASCSVLEGNLMEGKKAVKKIIDAKEVLEEAKDKAKQGIIRRKDKILQQVTQQLNKKVEDLLAKYDELYIAERVSLVEQEKKAKGFVEELESYVNLSYGLLDKGTDEEIVSAAKSVKKSIEKLREERFPRILATFRRLYYNCSPIDDSRISACVEEMGDISKEPNYSEEELSPIDVIQFIQTVYSQDLETFKTQNYVDIVLSQDKGPQLKPMRKFEDSEFEDVKKRFQRLYEVTAKDLKRETLDLSELSGQAVEKIKKSIMKQRERSDVMVEETSSDVFTLVGETGNVELFRKNVMGVLGSKDPPAESKPLEDDVPLVATRKGVRVMLMMGAIEKQECEAIVNFTDNELVHRSGVPYAIREAAGEHFWTECRSIIAKNGPLVVNMVTITTAGSLPSRFVIHAILPDPSKERRLDVLRYNLEGTCRLICSKAIENNLQTICFPVVTQDITNLPTAVSSRVLFIAIKNFIEAHSSLEDNTLKEIRVVFQKSSKTAEDYKKEFKLQF